jgi:hypothetical protein
MSTISPITPSVFIPQLSNAGASAVLRSSIPGLAQTAVSLSVQEGIVATLSGAVSAPVTYNAAGLLNTLILAGTANPSIPPSGSVPNPQATAQNEVNQGIVNTIASSPAASGIYNASGTIEGLTSGTSADWASILKANPNLSSTLAADSVSQGIAGILSVLA